MQKPITQEIKKVVMVGGSTGIIFAPGQLLRLGWKQGDYARIDYFEDKIEVTKYIFKTNNKGKS